MSIGFEEVSPEPAQGGGGGALATVLPLNGRTREMDNELIAWAQERYNIMRNERIPLERQWYVNLAFIFGRHNVSLMKSPTSTLGFNLVVPKAPPWRVRMVINHCRRIMRTEVSKLASQRPRPFVVPATIEDEDQSAARIAETILEAEFSSPEFGEESRSWIWWTSGTGTAFLKMYWDKDKEYEEGSEVKKGKICIERLTPFQLLVPRLSSEKMEQQPYVCHASTMDVEDVEQKYGVRVEPNAVGMTDMMEDAFLNLVGAQQLRNDKALVLEFWIKPGKHKQFPHGGMFVVAGDKLVQVVTAWPYKHKHFPFYKNTAIFSGKFYGDSILVDVIPLNRELNRTRSQITEWKNLMSKPKWTVQRGALNPKAITSEPGQVLPYNLGFDRPEPVAMPPMPATVSQELERLQIDMDDLSGQHEITRGNNPSQVTAATALSYLQEQDDSKLYYNVASIEDATTRLGSDYLKLVAQYWNTERLVRIVGEEGILEAETWKGSDLRGNTDVRVLTGSGLPQSKAAKQAFVMDLLKLNLIPPEKGIEMLEIGGLERIYQEVLADKRAATRENIIMAKLTPEKIKEKRDLKAASAIIDNADPSIEGVASMAMQFGNTAQEAVRAVEQATPEPIIPVNSWDAHELHIQYHDMFRKSQRFSLLPDDVKLEFELHVVAHHRAIAEKMALAQGQMPGPEVTGDPNAQPDPMALEEPPYQQPGEPPQEPALNGQFAQSMQNGNLDGMAGMGTAGNY